jgi:hypothetical protein
MQPKFQPKFRAKVQPKAQPKAQIQPIPAHAQPPPPAQASPVQAAAAIQLSEANEIFEEEEAIALLELYEGGFVSEAEYNDRLNQLIASRQQQEQSSEEIEMLKQLVEEGFMSEDEYKLRLESLTAKDDKQSKMRIAVMKELVQTEQDYVKDLRLIQTVYIRQVTRLGLLSAVQTKEIFGNIEQLAKINEDILSEIQGQLTRTNGNFENVCVGEIFLSKADFLKMYTVYCTNLDSMYKSIAKFRSTNVEFNKFLKEIELTSVSPLDLPSYLIKPNQRICKYPLLLSELLKFTKPDHVDYSVLQQALVRIENVASHINEYKRRNENTMKILELESKLGKVWRGKLLEPTRVYVRESLLFLWSRKAETQYMFFLMNDMIVWAKPKAKKSASLAFVDRVMLAWCTGKLVWFGLVWFGFVCFGLVRWLIIVQ